MDESTTNPDAQDEQALEAQPVEALDAAANTDSESIETTDQTDSEETAEAATSEDDDLSDYWAKKGIDITTAEGQAKAAKSYREAEKAMTKKAQQASELAKKVNEASPIDENASEAQQALQIAQQLRNEAVIDKWARDNKVTESELEAMDAYVDENVRAKQLLGAGLLTLDEVRKLSINTDTAAIKKQGGQEALQNLANKQRASAATGNAVNSTPPAALTAANAEAWWDSLGAEGRADPANRAKLDALL